MNRILAASLLLIIAVSGFAQSAYTAAGLYKYSSPVGYARNDGRVPKGRVGFFATPKGGYSANVMITTASSGNYNASGIGNETVAYLKKNDKAVSDVVGAPTKLGGKAAYSIKSLRKLPNGMVVKQEQVIGVHKGTAVILTFSSLKASFPTENTKFGNSLKSWTWLN